MVDDDFRERLWYSAASSHLERVDHELARMHSVRFMKAIHWGGGKRLRATMFLLSYRSIRATADCDARDNDRIGKIAAAIELLHEASLIHDDLIDGSALRRGQPSAFVVNGSGLALLIGDYLIIRGLKEILDTADCLSDIKLAQSLADTGLAIAHGEAEQLHRFLSREVGEDRMAINDYLSLVERKTATFFAACAEAGAALAGAGSTLRCVYREFGLNLGIAFQIIDDLIDIAGDRRVAQKTLHNNLAEGTITLPMIYAYQLYPDNAALQMLAQGETLNARELTELSRILQCPQILAACSENVRIYTDRASEALFQMPEGFYRLALADLMEYIGSGCWGGVQKRTKGRSKRDY